MEWSRTEILNPMQQSHNKSLSLFHNISFVHSHQETNNSLKGELNYSGKDHFCQDVHLGPDLST